MLLQDWPFVQRWQYNKRVCAWVCVNVHERKEVANGNETCCIFLWRFWICFLIRSWVKCYRPLLMTGLLHTITESEAEMCGWQPQGAGGVNKVKIAACNIFELRLTARILCAAGHICLIPVTARIFILTKVVIFHHASYVRRNLVKPARVQLLIECKASYASHAA